MTLQTTALRRLFLDPAPACYVGAHHPSATPAPAPVTLKSKNGIPLPLRAMPWRDLNREFWSKGQIVPMRNMERSQPRELLAHEKDASEMSLDELVATATREPLSESRRSWLTRGAGVMSLEGLEYGEGSIGETIAASSLDLDTLVESVADLDLHDEHDAVRFGTPIELVDPITAKQIEYQQQQHGNSEVVRVRLAASANGGIALNTDRKLMPEPFIRLAKSVKRTLATSFGPVATLADLHARVDLLAEAQADSGVTRDFGSADPDEERERFLAPADAEWHSAYESVQNVVTILSEDWSLNMCNRRGCQTMEEHRHERIARLHHRRPQNVGSADEFWRQQVFDVTAFELGTHGLVDPLVVEPFTQLYPISPRG